MDCSKPGFCQVRRFCDPTGQGCKFRLYHPFFFLGTQLVGVTQDKLEHRYKLQAASADSLFEAVQGLSDASATLACTSHASMGGPVLWSVSRQLACFMPARALKGVDLS